MEGNCFQAFSNLLEQGKSFYDRNRTAPNPLSESLSRHELQNQEMHSI